MIRALLVDDEELVLETLEKNIHWKTCGIDYVFKAETVDEALQLYMTYKPDIIITDIEMPDGSGLELIEKLKAKDASVACLCVTCHPEFGYMRKAMQLGSVDYILKPVEYEELELALKKIIMNLKKQRYGIDTNVNTVSDVDGDFQGSYYEDEKLVFQAQQYIRIHLSENISVQKIAESFHCSASHLMHIFKRKVGKTVIEYVTSERIEKSKQLLRNSDLQVNVVARLAGYEDYSYFSRVFKKETGQTPRDYREKMK